MAEPSSITSCGRSCSSLFPLLAGSLDESGSLQSQLSSVSVKEASKRFELWARNIAALQDAHLPSSLEHRLRDDSSARNIVMKALLYLEESLQMAMSIASGERENEAWDLQSPDVEPTNSSGLLDSSSSELKELGLAIQEGISNLFQLSMIIRKKPEKDEYLKASLAYTIDPTADIVHVGDKYPPAKKGDKWLMERLGTAITRRRQYLLYRKEHQEKMEQIHTLKVGADGKTVWSGEKASTYHPNDTFEDSRPVDLNIQGFKSSARTEYADSSKGKDGASDLLRTPLLPKDSVGVRAEYNQHFECPYCWRPQKVGDKTEWKKHIFSDLRPYVCTFESCGLNMFESQNQWFEHEIRFHRQQWTCQHCKEAPAQSRPELEKHMSIIHGDKVREGHLDSLLNACQNLRINATECPLCTEYGEKFQRINQSKKCDVSLKQFQEHLGRHMEQLALSALPQEEVDEDEGPASDNADSIASTTISSFGPGIEGDLLAENATVEGSATEDADASDDSNSISDSALGIDPTVDPELALALRMSIQEERARVKREKDALRRDGLVDRVTSAITGNGPNAVSEVAEDILRVNYRGFIYLVNFPAYSIGDGKLLVGDMKGRAAASMDLINHHEDGRLKFLYKDFELKNDTSLARDYGIKNNSEVFVVLADGHDYNSFINSVLDDKSDEPEERGRRQAPEIPKESSTPTRLMGSPSFGNFDSDESGRAREKGKNVSRTEESSETDRSQIPKLPDLNEKWIKHERKTPRERQGKEVPQDPTESELVQNPTVAREYGDLTQQPSRDSDFGGPFSISRGVDIPELPKPRHLVNIDQGNDGRVPRITIRGPTPMDQLDELSDLLLNTYLPRCERFISSPPDDYKELTATYQKLNQSIASEVLMRLDGVKTEGDPEVRALKKGLIAKTQEVLSNLTNSYHKLSRSR